MSDLPEYQGVDLDSLSLNAQASLAAWKIFDEAIRAQNGRIDEDIALLVRAGIAYGRIAVETHPDAERRLTVDGRAVARYTITYTVEGEEVRR